MAIWKGGEGHKMLTVYSLLGHRQRRQRRLGRADEQAEEPLDPGLHLAQARRRGCRGLPGEIRHQVAQRQQVTVRQAVAACGRKIALGLLYICLGEKVGEQAAFQGHKPEN